MITRLLPDQISAHWDVIKYGVERSLPPIVTNNDDKMNRILSSLLSGKTQCWLSYERDGERSKLNAVVLTKMLYDEVSGSKNLLLYSVYGYSQMTQRHWMEGFAFMSKHALAQGCTGLVAYTDVPYLIEMAKQYGAEPNYTFVSFEVKQFVQILNNLPGE